MTVDGVTFDTADPAAIHENVEEFVVDALVKSGMDQATALKVAFWNFGEIAEDAFYRSHGLDPERVEVQYTDILNEIAARKADDVPPDLFKGTYPDGDPAKAGPGPIDKPTTAEVAKAREILADYLAKEREPANATTISGQRIKAGEIRTQVIDLPQARDLGVIGPPKEPPAIGDSPSELADRAYPRDLSSARTPLGASEQPLGHRSGEYDQRGKEWIDKIDEPDGVRDAIEKIANDHDYFPEARGGVASPAARNAVAAAAGINPADIDREYFATHFDSDGKVRAVIQALRQTAKDFSEASDRAIKEPSVDNAAAVAEAELRHTHVLEYTLGLRAESGRTLNSWKELLKETEHTKATVAIKAKEQTGEVPKGTVPVVDAVKEVQDNLKTPGEKKLGLQNLIDRAKELVDNVDGTQKAPEPRAPLSPELSGLVGEARNVLKKFGADTDVQLEDFRKSLQQLSAGEGKLGDTVEAARELLKKIEEKKKPKSAAEAKEPSERGKLVGAAKRLVAAADDLPPEIKAGASPEMAAMMETARQAVGRLKTQRLSPDLAAFRKALADGDPDAAQAAARRLMESETKPAAGQSKPPVEHNVIMAAAQRLANVGTEAGAKEKPPLPRDIADLVDETRDAVSELQSANKSVLGKLIDQAEQQAIDMVKTKAVKNPIEALPPELQALVDKSQRVTSRFGGIAKGERAAMLLARTGRTAAEQERLARSVAGLTPNQVASVLNKLRTSAEAERPGWFYWLWQQGLISGLITHAKYLTVNTATILLERTISPTLAAVIGKARGETVSVMAPIYANIAMVHSLPDAFTSAGEAFRTGNRVPLASEMRLFERGEESPQSKGAGAAYMQSQSPDFGIWRRVFNEDQLDAAARVLGIPGRSANMIHTFYKVLSERSSQSMRAYNNAFAEGVKGDKFWDRYKYHLDNPSDDDLRGAVNDAYSGAFMSKLSPKTDEWARALKSNPVTKWLFPFQHIPWNIERMSVEYSPFKVLGPEMRSALLGQKGAPAQNLAVAKMVIGSSIIGYFIHKEMAGEATADYPTNPQERRKWELLNMQPNSIKAGGEWVNLDRLGPVGNVAHMGAAIGSIIRNYNGEDDDALTSAIWAAANAAANQIGNEVGFQTLRNVFEALRDEKSAQKFVAWQSGSLIYPSSLLSQSASFIDPYQRQATNLVDGLKYRIPFFRATLPPKRDALYGEPVENPGYLAILRRGAVNADPVKAELDRIKVYPAAPDNDINGLKLPPKIYDLYEATAGALKRQSLEALTSQPGWNDIPIGIKQHIVRSFIKSANEGAKASIMVAYEDLIRQGVQNKIDQIDSGKSEKKRVFK
jgi:hypothetical protein